MSRTTANLLRLLSIIAVMVIHATSRCETAFLKNHLYLSDAFLGVLLNQVARFSVPVFVLLSGYGLTMKYRGAAAAWSRSGLMEFFRGRAFKVLLPFLFWTVLYFFLLHRYVSDPDWGLMESFSANLPLLLKYLTRSGVDYHFYFFIIILQCYLVFPFLFRYRRKWLWWTLLIVHILFTAPSHYLFAMAGIKRPGFFSAFLLYWVFWFYTGVMISDRQEKLREMLSRIRAAGLRCSPLPRLRLSSGSMFTKPSPSPIPTGSTTSPAGR